MQVHELAWKKVLGEKILVWTTQRIVGPEQLEYNAGLRSAKCRQDAVGFANVFNLLHLTYYVFGDTKSYSGVLHSVLAWLLGHRVGSKLAESQLVKKVRCTLFWHKGNKQEPRKWPALEIFKWKTTMSANAFTNYICIQNSHTLFSPFQTVFYFKVKI